MPRHPLEDLPLRRHPAPTQPANNTTYVPGIPLGDDPGLLALPAYASNKYDAAMAVLKRSYQNTYKLVARHQIKKIQAGLIGDLQMLRGSIDSSISRTDYTQSVSAAQIVMMFSAYRNAYMTSTPQPVGAIWNNLPWLQMAREAMIQDVMNFITTMTGTDFRSLPQNIPLHALPTGPLRRALYMQRDPYTGQYIRDALGEGIS